jgi:hypothetical protein
MVYPHSNGNSDDKDAERRARIAKEYIDMISEAIDLIDELPDNDDAISFGESVGKKLRSMSENIEQYKNVTPKQRTAIENMKNGIEKWIKGKNKRR